MASTTAAIENGFAEQFRDLIKSDANGPVRDWRERSFAGFTDLGFPSVKMEDWKYTNVAAIAGERWGFAAGPRNADFVADDRTAQLLDSFNIRRNGFTALNAAFAELQIVRIPKDTVVDAPIDLSFGAGDQAAIFPHVIVVVEAGSKATVIENYGATSKSFTNTAVQVIVEDNASVTHYRVQKDSLEAFHVGTTEVTLGRDSRYDSTNINLGAAISRHDIELKFTAEGGEAWVDGLYMLGGSQHADTHSVIDHTVPNCTSHQNYKGVLNDRSRGVFNGKVLVRENAHGTDAHQSNKNLLLSNDARVDTKPQLEIFNDDVKCAHGATVGQLEEEELFYLLTRGLPDALARNLLTYGFAEAIIRKIGIESIKAELDEAVLNRLNVKLEV